MPQSSCCHSRFSTIIDVHHPKIVQKDSVILFKKNKRNLMYKLTSNLKLKFAFSVARRRFHLEIVVAIVKTFENDDDNKS